MIATGAVTLIFHSENASTGIRLGTEKLLTLFVQSAPGLGTNIGDIAAYLSRYP